MLPFKLEISPYTFKTKLPQFPAKPEHIPIFSAQVKNSVSSKDFLVNIDQLSATAVYGPYQVLSSGWMSTLRNIVNDPTTDYNIRSGHFAFRESVNALEDTLGLSSALDMSRVGLLGNRSGVVTGRTFIRLIRVGSGSPWALLLVLPALFSAIVLMLLWWAALGSGYSVTDNLVQLEDFVLRSYAPLNGNPSPSIFSP